MYSVALVVGPVVLILFALVVLSRNREDESFELALTLLERRFQAPDVNPVSEYRVTALHQRAKRFLRQCVFLAILSVMLAIGLYMFGHLLASLAAGFLFVLSVQFLLEAVEEYASRSKRIEGLRRMLHERSLLGYAGEA